MEEPSNELVDSSWIHNSCGNTCLKILQVLKADLSFPVKIKSQQSSRMELIFSLVVVILLAGGTRPEFLVYNNKKYFFNSCSCGVTTVAASNAAGAKKTELR